MYDKQVRRRRAVLFALVVCCLVLLTAYFGESKRRAAAARCRPGAMEVVAPVQEGAIRALKPFRDLAGWFGDTIDAKGERDEHKQGARPAAPAGHPPTQADENENAELHDPHRLRQSDDGPRRLRARHRAGVRPLADASWYSTINDQQGLERRRPR